MRISIDKSFILQNNFIFENYYRNIFINNCYYSVILIDIFYVIHIILLEIILTKRRQNALKHSFFLAWLLFIPI